MSNAEPYQIVNLKGRDIVTRKCQCKRFLTPISNSRFCTEELFHCYSCKAMVKPFITHFKIDVVLLDLFTHCLLEATMYDQVAVDFMGCTPIEYLEYAQQDDRLYEKLEDTAVGMFVDAQVFKNANGQMRVHSCRNQNEEPTRLIHSIVFKDGFRLG